MLKWCAQGDKLLGFIQNVAFELSVFKPLFSFFFFFFCVSAALAVILSCSVLVSRIIDGHSSSKLSNQPCSVISDKRQNLPCNKRQEIIGSDDARKEQRERDLTPFCGETHRFLISQVIDQPFASC